MPIRDYGELLEAGKPICREHYFGNCHSEHQKKGYERYDKLFHYQFPPPLIPMFAVKHGAFLGET